MERKKVKEVKVDVDEYDKEEQEKGGVTAPG